MDTYWVPGVNNLRTLGRWAFAELAEIYWIDADFKARVGREFDAMIERAGRNFRLTPFCMCGGHRLRARFECRRVAPQRLARSTSAAFPQKTRIGARSRRGEPRRGPKESGIESLQRKGDSPMDIAALDILAPEPSTTLLPSNDRSADTLAAQGPGAELERLGDGCRTSMAQPTSSRSPAQSGLARYGSYRGQRPLMGGDSRR